MKRKRYSPDELLLKYSEIREGCTTEEFMRSPTHKKTQELWCAAHFSRAYQAVFGPCWIHISDSDEQEIADFWFEVGPLLHPFQITETLDPDRRRGDEYKRFVEGEGASILEDWGRGTDLGPEWTAKRIKAKADRYGSGSESVNLLVYLNFTAYDQQYVELRETAREQAAKFRSVWLLNGNAFCCIKPNPDIPAFEYWRSAEESLA